MRIRQATDEDLGAILAVVRRVVPLMQASGNQQWGADYPNREVFARDVTNSELWVAELAGQVAGVVAICREQSPEYADAGWDLSASALVVHRLAVAPEARGHGVAAALMAQAERLARASRITQIRLDTNTENKPMQALVERLGYALVGEISLLRRPGLRFRCYEKVLST